MVSDLNMEISKTPDESASASATRSVIYRGELSSRVSQLILPYQPEMAEKRRLLGAARDDSELSA